ncbi:MAG: DsrE family protein [Gammaproteobacteria bacterium]
MRTIWNALRLASTTLGYDHSVTVFLLGKGVECVNVKSLKYDIREQLQVFAEHGGSLMGCGVCVESRADVMPFLGEDLSCVLGSMQNLYGLIHEADKVLTF